MLFAWFIRAPTINNNNFTNILILIREHKMISSIDFIGKIGEHV